jgi:hypothetical protein
MAITYPECGDDVTEKVMRKRRETTTEFRSFSQSRLPKQPVLVVVTCRNGHTVRA